MTAIIPIPTVAYRWSAMLPERGWTGTVKMPDCDGALEACTRELVKHLRQEYGLNTKRRCPIIIWRRVE